MLRASRRTDGTLLTLSDLIGRLVWGAVGEDGSVSPLNSLIKLSLPLCEVAFAGESHYLVSVTEDGVSITACGGELGETERSSGQPLCAPCRRAVLRETC